MTIRRTPQTVRQNRVADAIVRNGGMVCDLMSVDDIVFAMAMEPETFAVLQRMICEKREEIRRVMVIDEFESSDPDPDCESAQSAMSDHYRTARFAHSA